MRQFGEGPLSRATALIYTLVIVEGLLVLTAAPGLAVLLFLDRDASNLPLVALCALPVGPALSAAVYALHHRSADITDLQPAAAFWRGYRLNAVGALKVWVPGLAWLTIVAVTLANFRATGLPLWWAVLVALTGAATALWLVNALVITSLFAFRGRDVARLAAYFLFRKLGVTVSNACLLIVAGGVVFASSEAVLALFGSLFVAMLVLGARPLFEVVRQEYTA
ncbi:hypothetical protein [Luedemannella helvata]|uniref:hypothetical protein n=1 Tax=Luedemannella helvata TaxID=349315 RepID=UPI0031D1D560